MFLLSSRRGPRIRRAPGPQPDEIIVDVARPSHPYGGNHKKLRAILLPAAYGTQCPLCGETMWEGQRLHLDHVVPVIAGGAEGPARVTHARCNMRRGQAEMVRRRSLSYVPPYIVARRQAKRQPEPHSREWDVDAHSRNW